MKTWPVCLILVLATAGPTHADLPAEVRVSLFTIFGPKTLEISGVGDEQISITTVDEDGRSRSQVAHHLLVACGGQSPLVVEVDGKPLSTAEIRVMQTKPGDRKFQIGIPGRRSARTYHGRLVVKEDAGECLAINHVGLEFYVQDVTCREQRGSKPEALRAVAVLARTWSAINLGKHAADGFDFCDLTHCQAYEGASACRPAQKTSLDSTRGKVLRFGNQLAQVAYFSTCGGHTARGSDIWGIGSKKKYLGGVQDGKPAHCSSSPHYRWRLEVARDELCKALQAVRKGVDIKSCQLEVTKTGAGGWVKQVRVTGAKTFLLSGEQLHMILGRALGWGKFKSANFILRKNRGRLTFIGRGMGHGVGLCQYGAMELARQGKNHVEILLHYFPGTRVGKAP